MNLCASVLPNNELFMRHVQLAPNTVTIIAVSYLQLQLPEIVNRQKFINFFCLTPLRVSIS